MKTLKPCDYTEYSQWFMEMMGEPAEEDLDFLHELRKDTRICIYTEAYAALRESGMLQDAIRVALITLMKFPNDPEPFQNFADALWAIGLKQETKRILQLAVERFPGDRELIAFLEDVEDDLDNDPPNGGELLTLLLVVVAVSAHKKFGKKM